MERGAGKEFLGQGWAFPPRVGQDTGRIAMTAHEEDIKQSIRIIVGLCVRTSVAASMIWCSTW